MGSPNEPGLPAAPEVGDVVDLLVESLAFGGEGLAHLEGLAVFVPFVVPGESVRTEITERKQRFARGKPLAILTPSPDRIDAPCPYFTQCGGCQYQQIPYSRQPEIKRRQLRELIQRIGGFTDPPIRPAIPSPLPYGYRNRILVRAGYDRRTAQSSLGFLRHEGRGVVDVAHCAIAQPEINRQLQDLRRRPDLKPGTKYNLRQLPEDWSLPPDSFFQINDSLLPAMIATVRQDLQDSGTNILLDVYCGTGFFCIALADQVERFLGIEIDPRAIAAARENARRRGRDNGTFIASRAEVALPRLIAKFTAEDTTVLLDPPRKGCDRKLIDSLLRHRPRQILYISCHPATLARDLKLLCGEQAYDLAGVTPLDLFPQTAHLECVCDLRRR